MSKSSQARCWYWPLVILLVLQRPVAGSILKYLLYGITAVFLFHYLADGYKKYGSHQPATEKDYKMDGCQILIVNVNSPARLSLVQACSIDSVAYHHEDLNICLAIFEDDQMTTIETQLKNRDNLRILQINLIDLLRDTPVLSIWNKHRTEIEKSPFKRNHISRLVEAAFQWKHGGLVVDDDMLILKPIFNLNTSYVSLASADPREEGMSTSVTKVTRHHPFLLHMYDFFDQYDPLDRLEWDQTDFTSAVTQYCEDDLEIEGGREPGRMDDLQVLSGIKCQDNLKVFPAKTFCQIQANHWSDIFTLDEDMLKTFLRLEEEGSGVYGIKLWNRFSYLIKADDIKNGSGFDQLAMNHCPNVYYRNINNLKKRRKIGKPERNLIMKMRTSR